MLSHRCYHNSDLFRRSLMIFISYRIDDSNDVVDRLDSDLAEEFGRAVVFRDKKRLRGSQRWPAELHERAESSRAMLVVMGQFWQTVQGTEEAWKCIPRLLNPKDWVRREIITALKAGRTVVPVLLNNAKMPQKVWLRRCHLEELADKMAVKLRTDDYDHDLARLISLLRELCPDLPR